MLGAGAGPSALLFTLGLACGVLLSQDHVAGASVARALAGLTRPSTCATVSVGYGFSFSRSALVVAVLASRSLDRFW